jgi:tetratricopeptide (TPR) repeat protein
MKATTWFSVVVVFAVACKKSDDKHGSAAKAVDLQKPVPVQAAPADVSVTSKSPEAIRAFAQARDLVDHTLGDEAVEQFKRALAADPDFALAHAYLGSVTAGAKGIEHLAKAKALMATLPEAEQQLITAMHAQRAGDPVTARTAYAKVLELAPGAWRADIALAKLANAQRDSAEAIRRLEHALTIKPDLAIAYNDLAYAHAAQREWEPAIAAARKQVELMPKEPNPHDTLGEILLRAGKHDDAEKEFAATLALQPRFSFAWQGASVARGYRGDFKGAHEAIAKRIAIGLGPADKLDAMIDDAWVSLAEDKLAAALATLAAVDKEPGAKDVPVSAFGVLDRGQMLTFAGKYTEAAKAYASARQRSEQLAGNAKRELVRRIRIGILRNAALAGKPAPDADKLVGAFDDEAKEIGDNPELAAVTAYARGLAAWAKQDLKTAIAELEKCDVERVVCRFDLAAVQRKSGDLAGAQATEQLLRATPRRDMPTVYLLARL